MNLGIIGLPQVGKKTVFQILTGEPAGKTTGKSKIAYGTAPVRDPRIDKLSAMYNPKRTRYAEFEIALPPDISPNNTHSSDWLEAFRQIDAFIHIVRAFESPTVFHALGKVEPARDTELVESELLFADLDLVETRLQRLKKEANKKDRLEREREEALLTRFKDHLENEKSLRNLEIPEQDKKITDNLQLLTRKPLITVFNCDEDSPHPQTKQQYQELTDQLQANGTTTLFLNAELEQEISELAPEEQASFMEELEIQEPAAHRLSRAAFQSLGLISFFTVGPDEVRAWTLRESGTAVEAAGRIHSDLARGFIRAETIPYHQLISAGSEKEAKQQNLFQLKGKDYQVKDGDVLNIRFNV